MFTLHQLMITSQTVVQCEQNGDWHQQLIPGSCETSSGFQNWKLTDQLKLPRGMGARFCQSS